MNKCNKRCKKNEQVQQEVQSTLQAETIKMKLTREQSNKLEVIGAFISIGALGFCFGFGVMLAVKTVNSLEYCIEELKSRK